ncbi:uncharacterized protein [Drosophila bipectinata]|uniref:uncharacterized protein n=1 Tax=Drosophila bipectinata TaxID=42026 RepID=UPI0038B3E84F
MKTCCFYFPLQRGVFFIACFYIGADIFRLFFHLMVLYFPFDFVRAWYIPQHVRIRRSQVVFQRYEDDVHELVSKTMYGNPAQIIIILCLDLVTDCFLIVGTKYINLGVVAVGLWLLKAVFVCIVYAVVVLALAFVYMRLVLTMIFFLILAMEVYFVVVVGAMFEYLRRRKNRNEGSDGYEDVDETIV